VRYIKERVEYYNNDSSLFDRSGYWKEVAFGLGGTLESFEVDLFMYRRKTCIEERLL